MSFLTKLTVGTLAVLGAYSLKGKRGGAATPAQDKPASKRAKTPKPAAKGEDAASRSTARTAKRAAAPKAKSQKRAHRRTGAKRAQTR
jgi:hypothetical protein